LPELPKKGKLEPLVSKSPEPEIPVKNNLKLDNINADLEKKDIAEME
jgi:hypothetical protein